MHGHTNVKFKKYLPVTFILNNFETEFKYGWYTLVYRISATYHEPLRRGGQQFWV